LIYDQSKLRITRGRVVNIVAADEINRITPLGLTIDEAKAWYRDNVLMPAFRRGLIASVVASALVLATSTSIGAFLENILAAHMVVQQLIFLLAGFLYGYGLALTFLVASRLFGKVSHIRALFHRINLAINKRGILAFFIAVVLTVYWYVPKNFDDAALSESAHLEMRFSLLMAGILIFIGSRMLTKWMQQIAPIVAGKALGLFGMILILSPVNFYHVYPISQQSIAGVMLLVIMLLIDFTVAPVWLYRYFGKSATQTTF